VRLAASHRSRKGEGEGRQKRKAIKVVVPARIGELVLSARSS